MKIKFSEKAYLVTAISIFVTVIMAALLFSEELGGAFKDYPNDESIYWIVGLFLLIGFALLFGIFFIVSWRRERVEKHNVKRKCCAVILLVIFFPLAFGLPIYNAMAVVPENRGPYLSWTRDPKTSMTIAWESKSNQFSNFKYGTQKNHMNTTISSNIVGPRSSDNYYHYSVTLLDLSPNTEYWYEVPNFSNEPANFKTAPSSNNSNFKFILYGDSRESEKIFTNQHIDLVKQMLSGVDNVPEEYAFVINTGDLSNSHDFQKGWNLHYLAVKDLANHVPYMVAAGNHEWNTGDNWDPEQTANWIQEFPESDIPEEEIGGWDEISYAFGYGSCYFIQLGYPHAGANSTKYPEVNQWLNEQLEIGNTSYQFTFVSFHRPPFDDRVGTSSDDNEDVIRNQCPAFHLGNVDVVVNGHNHVLARHNITWEGDDDETEITYLTTGGGGASLRDYEAGSWDNKYGMGFTGSTQTSVELAKTYHYYVCEVDPPKGILTFTGYDVKGNLVDQFVQHAN